MRHSFTTNGIGVLAWFCPGCDETHHVYTAKGTHEGPLAVWEWNGSTDNCTLSPSVLVHANEQVGRPQCHVYIRDGKIAYLSDCTHSMAGQTIDVPQEKP